MSTRSREERRGSAADRTSPDRPKRSKGTPQTRVDRTTLMGWAWTTILVLISATVLLSILAFVHGWPGSPDVPAPPRPPNAHGTPASDPMMGACELRQQAERRWRAFRERLLRQELRQTEGAIQDGIDAAFAPIYGGIPAFLDWHYSVIGQYVELGQAAFGRLQEEFSARLFAGLQERIVNASVDVDRAMRNETRELIEQWVRDEEQTLPTEALRTTYQRMLDATILDTVQRFTVSAVPSGVVAVGAGAAGTAGATALAKGLTKKLTASTAVKTVGKAVPKIWGPLGAAAAGAAAGGVLGPAGAAIGGVIAGAAAWLALDSAFVNIDEHLNRSAFERDLIGLVDESKAQIKTALSAAVDEAKAEALTALGSARVIACAEEVDEIAPETLDGRTPSELSDFPSNMASPTEPRGSAITGSRNDEDRAW